MPTTQVKICGVTTPDALDAAIAARADYVGLMFFDPSPRNLSFAQASALAARSGGSIERVGVFVDPADDLLREAIAAGRLNVLQVHRVSAARRAEKEWLTEQLLSRRYAGPMDEARAVYDELVAGS